MKFGIRIIICTLMLGLAVLTASMALTGFRPHREAESMYILGTAEGMVAVFSGSDRSCPAELTEIELDSLREQDRAMLAKGLPVDSPEELARLLEDLGS